MRKLVLLAACLALGACQTTAPGHRPDAGAEGPRVATAETRPVVTLDLPRTGTLGEAVLKLSEEVGGCLVLLSGTENRALGSMAFSASPFEDVVARLAEHTGYNVQECPNYFFIYPEGYEALLEVSLGDRLDAAFRDVAVPMAFGHQTPLYEALALLSDARDTAIVADNMVADAVCGPMTLAEIPLQEGLEAILKSARIRPQAFKVDSTADYIFLYSVQNTAPADTRIGTPGADDGVDLDARVDVVLPTPPEDSGRLRLPPGALPLRRVLAALSDQLGVKVLAEQGLEGLPVNPCVFRGVKRSTALDLLIRQWPVPEFGYAVEGDRILIRRRPKAR